MTNRQIEELAKYCMGVSQLSLGSWVLGLFTAAQGGKMTVDNVTLFWVLFYIMLALLGIFISLVYLVSKKSRSK